MKNQNRVCKSLLSFCLLSCFALNQINLQISEFHPFPEKIKMLDLNPISISWSFDNSFLMIDNYKSIIFKLDKFGNIKIGNSTNHNQNYFKDLIWVGISPIAVQLVDRLENKVIFFDFGLNVIGESNINKNLYPEYVTNDPLGNLFFYSNSYNSIYSFDNKNLNESPFIDLNLVFSNSFCVKDITINDNFEFGILDCNDIVHFFNRNGEKIKSINSVIKDSYFLISVLDDWLVFNKEGEGISIKSQKPVSTPKSCTPIVDLTSKNKSIAILSKDHILVMDFDN